MAGTRAPEGCPGTQGAHPPGWLGGSPDTRCGPAQIPCSWQATWPSLCGSHLTPGAQPLESQDKTTWPWAGATGQEHTACSGPEQEGPGEPPLQAHPQGRGWLRGARVSPGRGAGLSCIQGRAFTLLNKFPSPPESLPPEVLRSLIRSSMALPAD